MRRSKWLLISSAVLTATLFQGGCLTSFWQGFAGGFPAGNRWLSIAVDAANGIILSQYANPGS
jgi:hypothetical protein